MKRDWQLIGALLEHIESGNIWEYIANANQVEQEHAILHLELLQDAGYIKNFQYREDMNGSLLYEETKIRLTMTGYDLKEVVNDQKLFNQIKDMANLTGVKLSWDFIKNAIPIVIKKLL